MIAELQSYAPKDRYNTSVNEILRKLDCLRSLSEIRGGVQDKRPTPEETDWLKQTKDKADRLQKDLVRMLHRRVCEYTRSTASNDEHDILVGLLGPCEGQESGMLAECDLDLTSQKATGGEQVGIGASNMMEMMTEYIRCTLAVIDCGVLFSSYRPTPPLPPLGEEGVSEVELTTRRSFRDLFRRNR